MNSKAQVVKTTKKTAVRAKVARSAKMDTVVKKGRTRAKRMSPEARQAQILATGVEVFAERG